MARVQVIHTTPRENPGEWELVFQWCLYVYDDGSSENGYRFIWHRSDGSLQPARGQARLPSIRDIEALINIANAEGWGNLDGS